MRLSTTDGFGSVTLSAPEEQLREDYEMLKRGGLEKSLICCIVVVEVDQKINWPLIYK